MISSHSWGDAGSQKRIQRLGGMVGPYAEATTSFVGGLARGPGRPRPALPLRHRASARTSTGSHAQPVPRPDAAANPVRYPFRSFDGGSVDRPQHSGTRVYDINTDGVDHYGLYPDWIEDLRKVAGTQIVDDMANGAEAYLQMWQRALR